MITGVKAYDEMIAQKKLIVRHKPVKDEHDKTVSKSTNNSYLECNICSDTLCISWKQSQTVLIEWLVSATLIYALAVMCL